MHTLNFGGNEIQKFDKNSFEKLSNLETLKLDNTNLLITDQNPFASFKKLRKLDISFNNLENVDFKHLATTLHQLQLFRAANAKIINAPVVMTYFGPNLNTLDLSGNFVGNLRGKKFENLRQLTNLYLSNSSLSDFDFSYLKQLKTLNISSNELDTSICPRYQMNI